jgi:hypothetical protein
VPERSGARRLSNRVGVAVRVSKVGDPSAALKRGDALLVSRDRPFVVALEGGPVGTRRVYSGEAAGRWHVEGRLRQCQYNDKRGGNTMKEAMPC